MNRIKELEDRVARIEQELRFPGAGRPGYSYSVVTPASENSWFGPYGYGSQDR